MKLRRLICLVLALACMGCALAEEPATPEMQERPATENSEFGGRGERPDGMGERPDGMGRGGMDGIHREAGDDVGQQDAKVQRFMAPDNRRGGIHDAAVDHNGADSAEYDQR